MRIITLLSFFLFLTACSTKIQDINYGIDTCDFCRMGIVDKSHSAQVVTSKGKNYKFDAIECLIHFSDEHKDIEYYHVLVAELNNPGSLINAKEAKFIISKNIPSPMGASLSAVKTTVEAKKIIKEQTGELFNWEEIYSKLNNY